MGLHHPLYSFLRMLLTDKLQNMLWGLTHSARYLSRPAGAGGLD
jgi:hypothetical protein